MNSQITSKADQIEANYKQELREIQNIPEPRYSAVKNKLQTDASRAIKRLRPVDDHPPIKPERYDIRSALISVPADQLVQAQALSGVIPTVNNWDDFNRVQQLVNGDTVKTLAAYFSLAEQGKTFFADSLLREIFEQPQTEYEKHLETNRATREYLETVRRRIVEAPEVPTKTSGVIGVTL